ncbi:MAG: hypothetical protein NTZ83_01760 [Candidatus Pacearchaeota archaeon]|nr:hypothetical protein [Candidatus Pacearchaeota archaeon]
MKLQKFIYLPPSCKKELLKIEKTDLIRNLYVYLNKILTYNLITAKSNLILKTPKEVWNTKKGHCFELSYFLIACLYLLKREYKLKINFFYLEQPYLIINKKWYDHASVLIEFEKEKIIIDLGRKIFKARYKKYNKIEGEKILGNYYIDSALSICNKSPKKAKKLLIQGLKLYSKSKRGNFLLKKLKSISG